MTEIRVSDDCELTITSPDSQAKFGKRFHLTFIGSDIDGVIRGIKITEYSYSDAVPTPLKSVPDEIII